MPVGYIFEKYKLNSSGTDQCKYKAMEISKTHFFRSTLFCAIIFISSSVVAQNAPSDVKPKYINDSKSIQNILDAYYDCISGPIGEVRDFERLKNLFHPEARLIYSNWSEESGKACTLIFKTVSEFIEKLGYLDKKGFYEHEVSNITHSFSSIAQVFSTYQFRAEDNSIPPGKGITSYEIFFDGDRYWIMSMFWVAENEKYKIPQKYFNK